MGPQKQQSSNCLEARIRRSEETFYDFFFNYTCPLTFDVTLGKKKTMTSAHYTGTVMLKVTRLSRNSYQPRVPATLCFCTTTPHPTNKGPQFWIRIRMRIRIFYWQYFTVHARPFPQKYDHEGRVSNKTCTVKYNISIWSILRQINDARWKTCTFRYTGWKYPEICHNTEPKQLTTYLIQWIVLLFQGIYGRRKL